MCMIPCAQLRQQSHQRSLHFAHAERLWGGMSTQNKSAIVLLSGGLHSMVVTGFPTDRLVYDRESRILLADGARETPECLPPRAVQFGIRFLQDI